MGTAGRNAGGGARMMEGFSDAPLALGELHGLRCWHYRGPGRPVMGMSWNAPGWQAGVNEAACRAPAHVMAAAGPGCQSPPARACPSGCGFWAYWRPPARIKDVQTVGGVAGVIRGWGRTLRGPVGFRCQKAEIVAFTINPAWALSRMHLRAIGLAGRLSPRTVAAALGDYYGVPVFSCLAAMLAEYPVSQPA